MGSKVNLAGLVLLAGGYLPWNRGIEFLDPLVIVPYAFLSLFYISAMLPPRNVWRLGIGGATYSAGVTVLGILIVNVGFWHGRLLLPPVAVCAAALVLSLSLSVFASATAIRLLRRGYTVPELGFRIRGVLLLLILAWLLRSQIAPVAFRESIAPLATTSGISLSALAVSFSLLAAAWGMLRGPRRESSGGGMLE